MTNAEHPGGSKSAKSGCSWNFKANSNVIYFIVIPNKILLCVLMNKHSPEIRRVHFFPLTFAFCLRLSTCVGLCVLLCAVFVWVCTCGSGSFVTHV